MSYRIFYQTLSGNGSLGLGMLPIETVMQKPGTFNTVQEAMDQVNTVFKADLEWRSWTVDGTILINTVQKWGQDCRVEIRPE